MKAFLKLFALFLLMFSVGCGTGKKVASKSDRKEVPAVVDKMLPER
jgi:hypothetical protein